MWKCPPAGQPQQTREGSESCMVALEGCVVVVTQALHQGFLRLVTGHHRREATAALRHGLRRPAMEPPLRGSVTELRLRGHLFCAAEYHLRRCSTSKRQCHQRPHHRIRIRPRRHQRSCRVVEHHLSWHSIRNLLPHLRLRLRSRLRIRPYSRRHLRLHLRRLSCITTRSTSHLQIHCNRTCLP